MARKSYLAGVMLLHNRYSLFLLLFLVLVSLGANGQVQSISDADVPCDKVYAVNGNTAIGANYRQFFYEDLVLFDLTTGALISSFDKRVHKAVSHGNVHYFILSDDVNVASLHLYLFQDGELLPAVYDQSLLDIYYEPLLDGLIGFSDEGFVFIQDGMVMAEVSLGARPLGLKEYGDGYIAVSKNAYFLINGDFTAVEIFSIPEGFESFAGAVESGVLLLSPPAGLLSPRTLSLYNITTQNLYPVLGPQGNVVSINYFLLPQGAFDNQFFLAGSGQIESDPFTYTHPTEAGFINISTGLYTERNSSLGLWKGVVQPIVVESTNGPLVFGRMGIEGVEPYTIEDQQIEIVKDIYEGFGGSIHLLIQNTLNYIDPLTRPASFELVQYDGSIYFSARSTYLGHQVWKTDGTEEGTYAITQFDVANKGYHKCFLSKDSHGILLTVLLRNGQRHLYRVGQNPTPFIPELDIKNNWEVAYATHPSVEGGVRYIELEHPGVHLAEDGSSLLILSRMDLWVDHMSFNHKWVLPSNKIQGFNAHTGIQILNADGSLKSAPLIRAREDQVRTVGRSFATGHVYLIVSHRPGDTFVNEAVLEEPREGHHLIELDDTGRLVKATFLPTGGKDRINISQLKITDEGIYLLGMGDSQFDLEGMYAESIAPGHLRAIVIKYSLDHALQWIADSGIDQMIFGAGLHNLIVGEESVFVSTGGTSYNVWSSCANSEWPYQISRFNKETGSRDWRRTMNANDVTRITSMELLDDQWLWLAGYTRGDLALEERQLGIVPNFLTCGYNDFLLCINTETGISTFLKHSDPTRPKFIQDIRRHEEYLYALSLVYEEALFPLPIYGSNNGRWNLQLDKFTNSGLHVDSLMWPTSISRTQVGDRIQDHKFSFDFHPDGGIVLSGQRVSNGTIDAFSSPSSEAKSSYLNYWLLQRRDIDALIDASLPPSQEAEGGDFEIYPNPLFGSSLAIRIPPEELGNYDRLILTDIQGRRCMVQSFNSTFESSFIEVDAALANGVYIIELQGTSRSVSKKLVLRR